MLTLRKATPEDLVAVWALVRRAVAQMQALGNPQWGEDYPTCQIYGADIARGELWLALQDGAPVGAACINTDQTPEYAALTWQTSSPAVVIHRLAVDPAAQRQGVATALLDFAQTWAAERGIHALRVDTYAQNERMLQLFRTRGLHEVGLVHFDRENRPLGFFCFEKSL